jgi:phytoene dehydrogenase-like protein
MGQGYEYDAVVVGAGPNGLAAAIRIAQHGFSTLVLEGSDKVGGACRTEELTLSGFWHDVGSAVHPLALASPFFSSLPLEKYGLTWIQPEVPLAHPISAREVTVLERSLPKTAETLGKDARTYRRAPRPPSIASRPGRSAAMRASTLMLCGIWIFITVRCASCSRKAVGFTR